MKFFIIATIAVFVSTQGVSLAQDDTISCATRESRTKGLAELLFLQSRKTCLEEYGIKLSNKESAVARLRLSNEVTTFNKGYRLLCTSGDDACCMKLIIGTIVVLDEKFDDYNKGRAFCNNLR